MCNITKKHNIATRFKMKTVWGLIKKKREVELSLHKLKPLSSLVKPHRMENNQFTITSCGKLRSIVIVQV